MSQPNQICLIQIKIPVDNEDDACYGDWNQSQVGHRDEEFDIWIEIDRLRLGETETWMGMTLDNLLIKTVGTARMLNWRGAQNGEYETAVDIKLNLL